MISFNGLVNYLERPFITRTCTQLEICISIIDMQTFIKAKLNYMYSLDCRGNRGASC